MESKLKTSPQNKPLKNYIYGEQSSLEEQKLKEISASIKDLKNIDNTQIYCYFSWSQIKRQANFLLQYLSREQITNRGIFFESLASFDSLLSIFKVNLLVQLKFSKNFYRNIQKEFELLCLELDQNNEEKDQKTLQFQLYSILFLLVMFIYFSGKKEVSQNKNLPLNILTKSFINNFISLDINITSKNQRIVGLIVSYLIKNINIKIYGERMLKFILNHFGKIVTPRTLYHFVYCLRQIHLEHQIDIKSIRKYSLITKIINFWVQTFYNPESVYLVDYLNVIFKKYKSLVFQIATQPLLSKLSEFHKINEFSIIHQGLILEIKSKLLLNAQSQYSKKLFSLAFQSCNNYSYSLKFLSCFTHHLRYDEIACYVFPYLNAFGNICRFKESKCILFALQLLNKIVQICFKNRSYATVIYLKNISGPIIQELKEFQIYKKDISLLQENFFKLISIQQYILC